VYPGHQPDHRRPGSADHPLTEHQRSIEKRPKGPLFVSAALSSNGRHRRQRPDPEIRDRPTAVVVQWLDSFERVASIGAFRAATSKRSWRKGVRDSRQGLSRPSVTCRTVSIRRAQGTPAECAAGMVALYQRQIARDFFRIVSTDLYRNA
jgi:hypothetical protein